MLAPMSEKSEELYDHALEILQSGDVANAITVIEEALMEDAKDSLKWRLYGVALSAAGRADDAAAAMAKAEEFGLDPVDSLLMKAAQEQIAGNLDAAISRFEDAIELDDERSEVWCAYALALVEADYHQDALDASDKSIKLDDGDSQVWYARGRILRMMGDVKRALPAFDKAVGINPDDALAHHERGMVQAEMEKFEDAAKSFERVLEIHPEDPAATQALGIVKSQI